MNLTPQQALISLALHAAYADGGASDVERESVAKLANRFQQQGVDLPSPDPAIRAQTVRLLATQLRGTDAAAIAYEMAASVCEADKSHSTEEQTFLTELRSDLGLEPGQSAEILGQTSAVVGAHAIPPAANRSLEAAVVPPVMKADQTTIAAPAVSEAELEKMMMNQAILAGALELLPSSLATMAIIPVQMRLVYRVGKSYGYELDQGHIKDLLATLGVGLTSQVVEGFVERVVRGVLGRVAGGIARSLGGQAASSGVSFATTYALGKIAQQYYAGGRSCDAIELRGVYESLRGQGRSLQSQYLGQIQDQAGKLDLRHLPSLLSRN